MTSRTPRRHRRLALMAAGTAAAMVLLPGAASAQVIHSVQQQLAGTTADPAVPPPGDPTAPNPNVPTAPNDPTKAVTDALNGVVGKGNPNPNSDRGRDGGLLGLGGSRDGDRHDGDDRHDDSDSDHIRDPKPPDHASGEVAKIDLLRSRLLDITRYDATIEDNGEAHSDSTVLGLGGSRIVGSSASSRDNRNREGDNGDALKLCNASGGVLCLSLLYHNAVANEDRDSSLAAARGGVAALCLGGHNKDTTASYECNGILSLGVAEGLGIAERHNEYRNHDKKGYSEEDRRGDTKAESANELLNLCLGKRDKLTTPCEGLGIEAVHADSKSRSDKPDTERHSFLLGIDSNGKSSYLLDEPQDSAFPRDCGDSALLCLLINQGRSVIFHNPKGAGSVVEALRLDVLNRTLLVVLGQAETLAHETEDHREKCNDCNKGEERGNKGEEQGNGEKQGGNGPELAQTGFDVAPLLAGGFLLTGLGALTVAATRRRIGKHSV